MRRDTEGSYPRGDGELPIERLRPFAEGRRVALVVAEHLASDDPEHRAFVLRYLDAWLEELAAQCRAQAHVLEELGIEEEVAQVRSRTIRLERLLAQIAEWGVASLDLATVMELVREHSRWEGGAAQRVLSVDSPVPSDDPAVRPQVI